MTAKLPNQRFVEFLRAATQYDYDKLDQLRLLVFDPGETTGVAFFTGGYVIFANQFDTKNRNHFPNQFTRLIERFAPNRVLIEDYRVYSWKRDQHSWAELHTPKLIGHMEAACVTCSIPYSMQMAQQAKGFCTDEKLKEWGLYAPSLRHARDAIRHGCYYLLFNGGNGQ